MRILFTDPRNRFSSVISIIYFGCEPLDSGAFEVFFIDSAGDSWHTFSMSFDDFEEYSYRLAVDGYIDLRRFVFSLDKDEQ